MSDPVQSQGWLLKLGGQVKKFKARHFRLSGSRLEYYRDDTPGSPRKGVIPLTGARLASFDASVYGRDFLFGITPSYGKRTYVLGADSAAQRDEWLTLLQQHVDKRDKRIRKSLPGTILEGVLGQWSEKNQKWNPRYTILTKDALKWMKDHQHDGKIHGEIRLAGSQVHYDTTILSPSSASPSSGTTYQTIQSPNNSQHFTFQAHSPSHTSSHDDTYQPSSVEFSMVTPTRTYYFSAVHGEEERNEWVTAISRAINAEGMNHALNDNSIPAEGERADYHVIAAADAENEEYRYSESETDEESELSLDSEDEDDAAEDDLNASLPPNTPPRQVDEDGKKTVVFLDVKKEKDYDRNSDRCVKEGHLKKLGAKVKNWKIRYFRLCGFVLRYYPSKEDTVPAGELHLIGTLVQAEPDSLFQQQFTFSVTQTTGVKRTYYMIAKDKDDMEDWIFLLKDRHRYSPFEMPLRLNPKTHVVMNMNPDEKALRAIAIDIGVSASNVVTKADAKSAQTRVLSNPKYPRKNVDLLWMGLISI